MGANLVENQADIRELNAEEREGVWELETKEECFHRLVGEFVKLSNNRQLELIP